MISYQTSSLHIASLWSRQIQFLFIFSETDDILQSLAIWWSLLWETWHYFRVRTESGYWWENGYLFAPGTRERDLRLSKETKKVSFSSVDDVMVVVTSALWLGTLQTVFYTRRSSCLKTDNYVYTRRSE